MSDLPVACFRCTLPGHGWQQCQRPGARTRQELSARIEDIKVRWDAGNGFALSVKKRLIEIEKQQFQPEKGKAA